MADAIFLIIGFMLLLGFAGSLFFKITKIPEILFLIIGGILIGPVFHIVDQSLVIVYAPFITALMLIVIMLDNGLSFNIFKVTRSLPKTSILSIGVMALTASAITIVLNIFFSFSLLTAAIIGLILSGTTTDIVTTLVSRMNLSKRNKQLVIFESVINDLQIIPFFILLHYAETSMINTASTINALFMQIPLTIVIAAAVAILWIKVIDRFLGSHPLDYIATLAILFVLYDVAQIIGGNGAIAVLVFSLILGNALNILHKKRGLKNKFTFRVLSQLKEIEIDTSFFVKTIFFVFLGIIFSFDLLRLDYIIMSLVVIAAILICRYIAIKIFCHSERSYSSSKGPFVWILPRGYVALVLAFAAVSSGIFSEELLSIVLLNIFLTTFIAIGYTFYHERRYKNKK